MKLLILSLILYFCFTKLFENKISERVIKDLSLKNGETSIFLMLKKQVDFDKVRKNGLLAREMDEKTRGYFVMNTLMENARKTQKEIINLLEKQKVLYKSYWVQNSIFIPNAKKDLIYILSEREDIDFIGSDELNYNEIEQMHGPFNEKKNPNEVEWNIRWVNADKLWDLGFNGTNIVVGGADTGIDYKHESLSHNYRGKTSTGYDHNYNWYDGVREFNPCRSPCGCATKEPCDDHNHGTHTLGTAVGGVAKKIGASPGSKWIGCRPFTDTGRHYSVQTFVSCLQFFLAPTDVDGKNPKPDLRPHTTIHSYGCNNFLGCPGPRDLEPASEALKAAGVFMIVAAHNQGPTCSSITRQPCHYKSVVTVGALGYNTDLIASYSSRGPITVDGSNRRKPDLSAPGSNVYSAIRNNQYARYSGTSMATPLVAGAISLFWSAKPTLVRNLEKTLEIFEKSAKHMNTTECRSNGTPNNVYGWGNIDVFKAYQLATEMGY